MINCEPLPLSEDEQSNQKHVVYHRLLSKKLLVKKFVSMGLQKITSSHELSLKSNCALFQFSSTEIAEQLTLYEKYLVSAIRHEEFEELRWMKDDKELQAPNMIKYIEHFNNVRDIRVFLN